MASVVAGTALLATVAFIVSTALVLGAPIATNDGSTFSNFKLPRPLDAHVVHVSDGVYKLVVIAEPDVTDVTTTVSLNQVVSEVTDGVEVLHLTKETEGSKWTSPFIRATLGDKDVLHLGVRFVQEGSKEMQSVNYFEMKIFDEKNKLDALMDLKDNPLILKTTKTIRKRATANSSDGEQADDDEQLISDRWGAHGRYHHGHQGGSYHGNSDFVQVPFLPVKIPVSVDSAFGLLDGFLGGGNRDQDAGHHRYRPDFAHRPNHDWNMNVDNHYHGRGGHDNGNDWGHNHNNRGNNGWWPDRHRPHNINCHHRDSSDESNDADSAERPHSSTRRPGPPTRGPWISPITPPPPPTTMRYTKRTTTPTPTITTEQIYDIDIRFGQGQPQGGVDNAVPKPDIEEELPAAV